MPRLLPGESPKIDQINEYVRLVQQGSKDESNESLTALLDLFKPMMLRLCKKWSDYFNDSAHCIKSFDDIYSECIYWFYHYTYTVYTIDGRATYNKFIKDHMDQRIRYIYECELKYRGKHLFPDPYNDNDEIGSTFDYVISKYSSDVHDSMEDSMVGECSVGAKSALVHKVLSLMECDTFNDREREVFVSIVCNCVTHEQMGEKLGISRTRVTQILAKTKDKLYKKIDGDNEIWGLLDDANIDITNTKLIGG